MERDFLKKADITTGEQGIELVAEYCLLRRSSSLDDGKISYESYGVGIRLFEKDRIIEEKYMPDIFDTEEAAISVLELIFLGRVTPCSLEDVVSDCLRSTLI